MYFMIKFKNVYGNAITFMKDLKVSGKWKLQK